MIFGGFIAGGIAALRSTDPSAAGLPASLVGGVDGVLTFVVTVVSATVSGTAAALPLPGVVFFVFAGGWFCVSLHSSV